MGARGMLKPKADVGPECDRSDQALAAVITLL
jgi:hypothetical protein